MPYPKYWTSENLSKLKSLYETGLSTREVGEYFGKSAHSISMIMIRNKIARRPSSITRKVQFQKSPPSFHKKNNLSHIDENLRIAGLMLYWGEGAKKNSNRVDFANSDPKMIKLFLKFLRQIYSIDESRLRVYLYTYNSLPTQELISYWSNLTKIPISQFSKPYIRVKSELKHDKMQYGLIHIRYSDVRLLKLIMDEIEQYSDC